jgi:hypothetical protein
MTEHGFSHIALHSANSTIKAIKCQDLNSTELVAAAPDVLMSTRAFGLSSAGEIVNLALLGDKRITACRCAAVSCAVVSYTPALLTQLKHQESYRDVLWGCRLTFHVNCVVIVSLWCFATTSCNDECMAAQRRCCCRMRFKRGHLEVDDRGVSMAMMHDGVLVSDSKQLAVFNNTGRMGDAQAPNIQEDIPVLLRYSFILLVYIYWAGSQGAQWDMQNSADAT